MHIIRIYNNKGHSEMKLYIIYVNRGNGETDEVNIDCPPMWLMVWILKRFKQK